MAEYLIQGETLDDIADAINAKTGGSSAMTPAQMVTEIGSIQTGGGVLPLGLEKVSTLIDTTVTVDNDITSNGDVTTFTLDPVLQTGKPADENYLIFAYVAPANGVDVNNLVQEQFVASASVLGLVRIYGFKYYKVTSQCNMDIGYTTNWNLCCSNSGPRGMFVIGKSASATSLNLALTCGFNKPTTKVLAGDYKVKAVLYKTNALQWEGSI